MKFTIIFLISAMSIAIAMGNAAKPPLEFGLGTTHPANVWVECQIFDISGGGDGDEDDRVESIQVYSKEDNLIPTEDIMLGHRPNKHPGGQPAKFQKGDEIYCNMDVSVPGNFLEFTDRVWRYPKFEPVKTEHAHLRRTNPLDRKRG
ncbi:uncharacterized protein LOC116352399 [Contarinia nasturtii]|uniref:uncharacterized protein LOC116352399 n=1 Tax=Contarinia nasturtii TaxID=265458 RepID=UPI0012D3C55A|nr:uncharacterized protein LOC116352399 [Contarinia nasturtii]